MMLNFWFLGFVVFLLGAQWIGRAIYNRWIRKPTSWDEFKGHYAVVTGGEKMHFYQRTLMFDRHFLGFFITASEGIGQGYAEGLAKRGLNLVIMARTKSKLDELASKLREKYNVDVR